MDTDTLIYYAMMAAASLISITLHECAHGYTALLMGDDTAKNNGRLTLNPIKHIDLFGLIMLIVMRIGWAKPVPVNPNNFTERKKGMFLVSIAGPLTNMLLAVIAGRLAVFFYAMDLNYYLIMFLLLFTRLNLGYGIFNILPFPPLDGSKLFASLLPVKWEIFFYKYQKYFYFVLIILYFIGALDVILYPAITFLYELILS